MKEIEKTNSNNQNVANENEECRLQQIVAVMNNKGGVGKTTTVQNLAAGIVRLDKHKRVLVVDLDPQCNLSQLMGLRPTECRTIFDAMSEISGVSVYKCYNGVYAVCGSAKMQEIEQHLPAVTSFKTLRQSYSVLTECLQRDCIDEAGEGLTSLFDDFDYIFIDCPPALSKSTKNALVAATHVLIPVQMGSLSVRGLKDILDVMQEMEEEHLNDDLVLQGLLPCDVDTRTNLTKDLLQFLGEHFGDKVMEQGIRHCVRVPEAQSSNKSIFDYQPYCTAGLDYERVVKLLYLQ